MLTLSDTSIRITHLPDGTVLAVSPPHHLGVVASDPKSARAALQEAFERRSRLLAAACSAEDSVLSA